MISPTLDADSIWDKNEDVSPRKMGGVTQKNGRDMMGI